MQLPNDRKSGAVVHTAETVYPLMMRQIAMDYPGLPDPRTMTAAEIVFWYDGLRAMLRKHTKPKES